MTEGVLDIDLSACPTARVVVNQLVAKPTPADLDQDLVLIELPDGRVVDVSWHPEHDPSGFYCITLCHPDDWDNPIRKIETQVPWAAAIFASFFACWPDLSPMELPDVLDRHLEGRTR